MNCQEEHTNCIVPWVGRPPTKNKSRPTKNWRYAKMSRLALNNFKAIFMPGSNNGSKNGGYVSIVEASHEWTHVVRAAAIEVVVVDRVVHILILLRHETNGHPPKNGTPPLLLKRTDDQHYDTPCLTNTIRTNTRTNPNHLYPSLVKSSNTVVLVAKRICPICTKEKLINVCWK